MDIEGAVEATVRAWNEHDPDARRRLVEGAWAERCLYADPIDQFEGREALLAAIEEFQTRVPGGRVERRSRIDQFDGWFRFLWATVNADGTVRSEGVDFGHVDGEGRIDSLIGFYGPLT